VARVTLEVTIAVTAIRVGQAVGVILILAVAGGIIDATITGVVVVAAIIAGTDGKMIGISAVTTAIIALAGILRYRLKQLHLPQCLPKRERGNLLSIWYGFGLYERREGREHAMFVVYLLLTGDLVLCDRLC
jgi:hypothetical protein